MSEAKFTEGEWYISHWESTDYYDLQVSTKDKTEANPCGYVCSLSLAYDDDDIDIVAEQEVNRANAHLIAAAPKMYDLLETIEIENDNGQIPSWLWDKIQLTLAKARGES